MVPLDQRPRAIPGTNAGHLVAITAVAPNDGPRVVTIADARHLVLVTVVVLNNRLRIRARADADTRASVFIALVAAYNGLGMFANTNAGAHVAMADIVDDQRARIVVPDAGVVVLKANIFLDNCGRFFHRSNASAHVSICDIAENMRRHALALRARDGDAGVADVMHDVVRHRAAGDTQHRDARRARRANVLVRLFLPQRGMVFLPKGIVVFANARHRKAIQRRTFGHRHARPFDSRNVAVNDRRLGTP